VDSKRSSPIDVEKGHHPVGVYYHANEASDNVSLLWGPEQAFRHVIYGVVSSMALGLLKSDPQSVDGNNGQGLTKAMGILGRNKGLQPWRLVFRFDSAVSSHMENASTWTPRPTKVLRSFYKSTMKAQYDGLGEDYVNATVELALIVADLPHWAMSRWLNERLEHQSLQKNIFLGRNSFVCSNRRGVACCPDATLRVQLFLDDIVPQLHGFKDEDQTRKPSWDNLSAGLVLCRNSLES
jgi:hypothetical protein